MGILQLVAAVIGAVVSGLIADKTREYLGMIRVASVIVAGLIIWFGMTVRPNMFGQIMAINALIG